MSTRLAHQVHDTYVRATNEIRRRFGEANIGRFNFSISCDGRTMTEGNEVKITYVIGANYEADVKGNDLEECIVEVMRRHGWNETNAPKALVAPASPAVADAAK